MRKAVSLLNRIALILGLLVALTPCGFCNASSMSQMKACSMEHMDGMKCCHSKKSQSPLCKVMDQSSVASVSHGSGFVAVPVVSVSPANVFLSVRAFVSPAFRVSSASPPQGLLALRI
ncbi:MAG TPA: hypothetical protein VIJ93_04835 [bacterium]